MSAAADRPNPWPLQFVRASGAAHDRGRQIGRALKERVWAHLEAWRASLPAGGDPDGYITELLADTDFKPAIRRHAPDLLEELEGVAEGASLAADQLFALQLLDEEWAYRVRRSAAAPPPKCSSLAIVNRDGPSWIGQNMDLGDYTDGAQVMLEIVGDARAPAALIFSTAGMLGLMGVNAAGVGVCVNSLPQLPSAPDGLPVAFVLRRLLQTRSLAEAVDLVHALPHATNQHYLIVEPGAARSFEASAAGAIEYASADPTRIFHTNHPLVAAAEVAESALARGNSEARLASLSGRLATGAPGLADIQDALCATDDPTHPVCRTARTGAGPCTITTGSMVSALTREGVRSWASAGPPRERGYHPFDLNEAV